MKRLSIFVFLLLNTAAVFSQTHSTYTPGFAAVVVSDIGNSSTWYQSVLQMTEKTQMNGTGYKIVILQSGSFMLEILELENSLQRSTVLQGKPNGTQIQGLFKIGFKLSNMDSWLKHLASKNSTPPQIWTDNQTGKRNFIISDPDGNLIQFFE